MFRYFIFTVFMIFVPVPQVHDTTLAEWYSKPLPDVENVNITDKNPVKTPIGYLWCGTKRDSHDYDQCDYIRWGIFQSLQDFDKELPETNEEGARFFARRYYKTELSAKLALNRAAVKWAKIKLQKTL